LTLQNTPQAADWKKSISIILKPLPNEDFVCQIGLLSLLLLHYQIILTKTDCLIIKKSGEIGLSETLATS